MDAYFMNFPLGNFYIKMEVKGLKILGLCSIFIWHLIRWIYFANKTDRQQQLTYWNRRTMNDSREHKNILGAKSLFIWILDMELSTTLLCKASSDWSLVSSASLPSSFDSCSLNCNSFLIHAGTWKKNIEKSYIICFITASLQLWSFSQKFSHS